MSELDRLAVAREALERIQEQQALTLRMIERNGFVFATPIDLPDDERTEAERWEKLAFSIYLDVCEIESIARAALLEIESKK